MMYVIFNNQGAIKEKQINEWIVQGSNNTNKIGVVIEGTDSTSYAIIGVCKLPNGEVITTTPSVEQAEIKDGVYGVVFSLTEDITALAGTLRINLQAINVNTDKVITSYTVFLCVNEGVDPGEILMMTAQQYQNLISKIELDVQQDETILTFSTLPEAENYSLGQIIYVKNENKLYECVENDNEEHVWHETFDFNNYYTKAETDDLLDEKQDKLTNALPTAQLQYTIGFDSQGNLRKGQGGGGGGATYTAGSGIDITDYTISIDDTVVATKTFVSDNYATKSSVESINALIPAQASSSNKLADKDFVNSSIATNTAYFIGTFGSVTELKGIGHLTSGTILKSGSILKKGSWVNGSQLNEDTTLDSDLTITEESNLAFESVIKSGSSINTGSLLNHIGYDGPTTLVNDITIETWTNNDYANVINSARDFASTTEMNAFNKMLLTNFDYAWIPNNTKYDLYRFNVETQVWTLQETNIAKTDVSLPTVYNRYTYSALSEDWIWNYSVNTSGFTAEQWAAINSGITAGIVADVALKSGNNTFTGNNTHSGSETFSGVLNPNANGYGFNLPSSEGLTANKTFATTDEIAPTYSSSSTYGYGDLVLYNGQLYRCKTTISTAEAWDSSHWTLVSVPLAPLDQAFNVINASDIVNNTLTQAQYDLITNGKPTLIMGQLTIAGQNYKDFYVNHLQVQANGCFAEATAYWIAPNTFIDLIFKINSSKVISTTIISIKNAQGQQNASFYVINGKSIEYYLNNVYHYATNSTTTLQYETINNITLSADTTYTLANAPSGTYPEYKGYITNSSGSSKTITLPTSVTKIKASSSLTVVQPTISGGSVTVAGTVAIPDGAYVEFSIMNNLALFVSWSD